jgi:regulation of enolase protein 1 (concanavalin A-like superfamily)
MKTWLAIGLLMQAAFAGLATEEVLFRDEFKTQLEPGWSWLRENSKGWRLSARGLEVRIEPGNMWGPQNDAKNVLLRAVPDPVPAELSVSVTVSNQPTHQYEQVDLVWYYNDSCMVKLGLELVDGKRSIVMGREEQDKTRTIDIIPVEASAVRLQLVVQGNRIRGRFKGIGDWREAGECDLPAPAGVKPRIALQFYQGPPDAEHWARATDFVVAKTGP